MKQKSCQLKNNEESAKVAKVIKNNIKIKQNKLISSVLMRDRMFLKVEEKCETRNLM